MSTFLVDSRTLLAVRDTLGRLHDQLLGMHNVIWSYWGVLGGRELEGELEHFCGTWHYGVTQLAGEITNQMSRLVGAAAAYERIEQRITAGGGSHGGSGTTVIGGGSRHGGGSGSGTTVIGGGSGHGGGSSGSGTTVIGGGPIRTTSSSGAGSGTTVIDEKVGEAQRSGEPDVTATLRVS